MFRWTPKTWVVVADGEKALILGNRSRSTTPDLQVVAREEQDNPPTAAQSTDRAGRRSDGGPNQRSAMEETNWHDLAKGKFARDLCHLLSVHAQRGEFDKLVLVAAPQVLGAMRAEMAPAVTNAIVAEVPKTLTNHPVPDIEKRLSADLEAL